MFSHVMVGVNDLEKSKQFYDAFLGALGVAPGMANKNRYFYRSAGGTFAISTPINGESACHGNGATIEAGILHGPLAGMGVECRVVSGIAGWTLAGQCRNTWIS